MKLLFSSLVAGFAATVVSGQSLSDQWAISEPTYNWDATTNTIDLDYAVSTMMTDANDGITIYDSDCGAGDNEATVGFTPTLTGLGDTIESGASFSADGKTSSLNLVLDLAAIAGTALYAPPASESSTATIVFCVRFGLSTTGGTPLEVNFIENVITMNIDLAAGFDVAAFNVAPKDKLEATATQTYSVTASRCVGTGTTLAEKKAATADDTYNQGEAITVCVYPGSEAESDGLDMETIQEFTWSRDDQVPALEQTAIVASVKEQDLGLTEFDGCEAKICIFSSILAARYYETLGEVSGSGTATMAFPNAATRRLGNTLPSGRKLQANEPPTLSEFDLTVGLNAVTDGPGVLAAPSGASALGFIVTTMGLLAAFLF